LALDPPEFIREAVAKALDDGFAANLPARGFKDLREAIAAKLKTENNIDAEPATEILVVTDTTRIVFCVCQYLIEAGEEVIIVDPGFNYGTQIELFGGKPVRVPAYESNGFRVDPEDIRASVSDKTKLIILNTPANPTGAVLDKTVLEEITRIALEYDFWILSDEACEQILYEGKKHVSIGSLDGMKDRTISAFSLSTSYAMAGWEVGYVTAPKEIIDEIEKLGEHMGSRVAAIAQRVALSALTGHRDFFLNILEKIVKNRVMVHQSLNSIEGVSCSLPASTFYAFANFSKLGLTSWNLVNYLLREYKVAMVPGSIFGINGEGFLRLTFAVDPAKLKEALVRIKKGVGQLFSY
jgi:aspartate/methionine/tyrosine aminotransferase